MRAHVTDGVKHVFFDGDDVADCDKYLTSVFKNEMIGVLKYEGLTIYFDTGITLPAWNDGSAYPAVIKKISLGEDEDSCVDICHITTVDLLMTSYAYNYNIPLKFRVNLTKILKVFNTKESL